MTNNNIEFKLLHINFIPILGWMVSLFFLLPLYLLAKTFLFEGGFGQFSFELEIIIFASFFLVISAAVIYILSIPLSIIYNKNNILYILSISIFSVKKHIGQSSEFTGYVQKDIDGEGEETFYCMIRCKTEPDIYICSRTNYEDAYKLLNKLEIPTSIS